jgi:transcriptional regulator of acetoin/glycerol metabolism
MKNFGLLGSEFASKEEDSKYTKKIKAPIYEPKNKCPHILDLVSDAKAYKLTREIQRSGVSEAEKQFLIQAAQRHLVFNYERIADYYSHASKEMQELMEKSALVIIDFDKAIEYGYVQLCNEISNQYLTEYGE